MDKIIIEIPPLGEADSYYLQERYKPCFNYPLHKHDALELIGCNLEHVWEQPRNVYRVCRCVRHRYKR